MSDKAKQDEMLQSITQMIESPALAGYIHTLPSGKQAMELECVAGLLLAMLQSADEAMEEMVSLIKSA
jgi:hypothetical protein